MTSERGAVLLQDNSPAPDAKPRRGPGRPTLSNEELLDKALDLFLEKGFERTSIDAITAAAGMAKRTVYLRYGDKTALFKAALERAIEEWIVPVERLRAAETEDLEETLLRIGHILLANILTPSGIRLLRITNAESGRMPEIGAFTYQQGTGPTLDHLADLFRRRLGLDKADGDEAALAFLYLVVGGPASVTAWGMSVDDAFLERHTRYCVRLFLHGVTPETGAASLAASKPAEGAADAEKVARLQEENLRLKQLLADAMLEASALKDRLARG